MDEQKQIKQMLAERCAAKGKTPIYITKLHSITDIFGQPVALADLKAGRAYKLSIDKQAMENANVVRVHHHRDRDDEWTTHSQERSDSMDKLIFVTDVLHHNGMVFIETNGMAFSTIDFPKEWAHVQKNAENQKFTSMILHAVEEQDKWLKDDSIKLAIRLDLMEDIVKAGESKEILNGMVTAIADYLNEHKPQAPFDTKTLEDIKNVAKLNVYNAIKEIERADNLAIARELVTTGMPLIYCRRDLKPERDCRLILKNQEHIPDKKFTSFGLNVDMGPMVNDTLYSSKFKMENLILLDVKKTDSGKKFYITDKAIFTNESMVEEYRQALEEHGADMDKFQNGMTMKSYLSAMHPGNREILCGHQYVAFQRFDDKQHKWIPNPEMISVFDDICAKLVENGIEPVLIKEREYGNVSNIRMLDANGVQHPIKLEDVCPGMKIMLIEEREQFDYNKISGNGTIMDVQEFLYMDHQHYAIVTDKGLFTTHEGLIEHYQGFAQNLEQEHVEIASEAPVIGE